MTNAKFQRALQMYFAVRDNHFLGFEEEWGEPMPTTMDMELRVWNAAQEPAEGEATCPHRWYYVDDGVFLCDVCWERRYA